MTSSGLQVAQFRRTRPQEVSMQTLGVSDSTPQSRPRWKEFVAPDLSSTPGAQSACDAAAYACFFIAAVTTAVAFFTNLGALLDALLFLLIGLGLKRRSRVAAVAGLSLYLIETAYGLFALQRAPGVLTIMIIIILVNAVRASFAYEKLRKLEEAGLR